MQHGSQSENQISIRKSCLVVHHYGATLFTSVKRYENISFGEKVRGKNTSKHADEWLINAIWPANNPPEKTQIVGEGFRLYWIGISAFINFHSIA
ncbi:hypothetical protein [Microbulbifer thermotolerans]|uniref:hypothetical protein n=1 Tax=Microbulbifer thermotolerans TaxID=252514 RepID=UPI0012E976D7|nr:hypothetical protein [Microbulbifer thermotolerans]MCX2840991.1 hypothetical protein [Microbulbifer thermotolerans]WKT60518.1 hypothetical protein Q2E61_16640 [Microbulbifer thermotolerans]